jgi:DNA helicase-2/ATP-dependent DNA helicase PcrA
MSSIAFTPRPAQARVLNYQRGKMGVAAVPGSGKTVTLSALAAQIVATPGALRQGQEVLVVTFVNSAVDNFAAHVGRFVADAGLIPGVGYRVRTLHGLAHDIIRQRPGLVGLPAQFEVLDERLSAQVLEDATETWLRYHPNVLDEYFSVDLLANEQKAEWVRRDKLPRTVYLMAQAVIRTAKNLDRSPAELADRLRRYVWRPLPLLECGLAIYEDYQRALAYRGAVDFDDLIRLALQALQTDGALLTRLQNLWPYILEDEAQDSSLAQEQMLRVLAGSQGNWVRVGDPNQAIFESFTTADPKYLREFLQEARAEALPNSGRSTTDIIDLANFLIEWTPTHPVSQVQDALSPPLIEPTPEGDPQPNPDSAGGSIYVHMDPKWTQGEELQTVVRSLKEWLPDHRDETVAVLVPTNSLGTQVVDALRKAELPFVEVLRSTTSTRKAAGALANILKLLDRPTSARRLATAYAVWTREQDGDGDDDGEAADDSAGLHTRIAKLLRTCDAVETFINPRLGAPDWIDVACEDDDEEARETLTAFRACVRRWQGAAVLPIDQLVATVAQDIYTDIADLALSHKIGILLRNAGRHNADWQLADFVTLLADIAKNEQRFLGMGDDDLQFDPDRYPGQVVVTTVHKAKGLEWDRVYLLAVNNFNYPSAMAGDSFVGEAWFANGFNFGEEALGQLDALLADEDYKDGDATSEARYQIAAERLRLLYVGITRARRELIITWNTGRGRSQPAVALIALYHHWKETHDTP